MDRTEQRVQYFAQTWINKIRLILEREDKLDDKLIFSVNPEDLEKCCFVGESDLSTYDILIDKIWIWLFRLQRIANVKGFSEDIVVYNIILGIEHEFIHKIDAEFVGKLTYTNLDRKVVETIVMIQQGRIKEDDLKQAIQRLYNYQTQK